MTTEGQGVALYDARTQTCVRSWQTPIGMQLSHAVCIHPTSGRLIGVRDQTVLFGWAADSPGMQGTTGSGSQTVSVPVLTLLQHASLLDGVVAVLADGSAAIFNASLTAQIASVPRPEGVAKTTRALWASLLPLPHGQAAPIALVTLMLEADGPLALYVRPLSPSGSGPDGRSEPLHSVQLPTGPPPLHIVPPSVAAPPSSASGRGRGAAASPAATAALCGCCLVPAAAAMVAPATDGSGAAAMGGLSSRGVHSNDAMLCLLWAPATLELFTVNTKRTPPAAAASAGAPAAPSSLPCVRRSIDGVAITAAAGTEASGSTKLPRSPGGVRPHGGGSSSLSFSMPCALQSLQPPALLALSTGAAEAAEQLFTAHPSQLTFQQWDARYGLLHGTRTFDLHSLAPGAGGGGGGGGGGGDGGGAGAPPVPVGACTFMGAAGIALAYPHAVLICRAERSANVFGLAHALCATQRTALALHADETESAGAAASGASGPSNASCAASCAAAAPLDSSLAVRAASLLPPPCRAQRLDSLLSLPPPAVGAASIPQLLPASQLATWRSRTATEAQTEAAVLSSLLEGKHTPSSFETALASFLGGLSADLSAESNATSVAFRPVRHASFAEGDAAAEEEAGDAGAQQRGRGGTKRSAELGTKRSAPETPSSAPSAFEGVQLPPSKRLTRIRAGGVADVSPTTPREAPSAEMSAAGAHGKAVGKAGHHKGCGGNGDGGGGSAVAVGVAAAGGSSSGLPLHSRVSVHFVFQVCAHCLRFGTDEWLPPLRPLLVSGAAASCTDLLLPALCERRALAPLLLFLHHTSAVTEEHLVRILELALRERQAAAAAAKDALARQAALAVAPKPKPRIVPFGARAPTEEVASASAARAAAQAVAAAEAEARGWDQLLDRLIGAPRNDVFLLQALRSLPLDDTVSLLQRLLTLLSRYFAPLATEGGVGAVPSSSALAASRSLSAGSAAAASGAPSLSQIVGWLNVLIDAHFSRLLIHAPCHGLLHSLNGLARRHVKACSSLKGLKGYLMQATESAPGGNGRTRPVPQYSQELLEGL